MQKNMIVQLLVFGLLYYTQAVAMNESPQQLDIVALKKSLQKELLQAIEHDVPLKVGAMLKGDHDMEMYLSDKSELLHHAARYCSNKCMKILLDHGLNPNAYDDKGRTPLHRVRCAKGAKVLLHYGADVHKKDTEKGYTPLASAVEKRLYEVVKALLAVRASSIDVWSNRQWNPLHVAAYNYDCAMIDLLLRNNVNPYQQNNGGHTPFDMVIGDGWRHSDREVLAVFEKYGMVLFPNLTHKTLLGDPYLNSQFSHIEPSKYGISNDKSGSAIYWNNMARLFAAAKKSELYKFKKTPTNSGIIFNEHGCIVKNVSLKYLETLFGSDVEYIRNYLDRCCAEALKIVTSNDSQRLGEYLKTLPFVAAFDSGWSRAMIRQAIQHKDVECLKILLENKIDCDIEDKSTCLSYDGGNFLHYALFEDNFLAVELLMQYGVDCTQTNQDGLTPMRYAIEQERPYIDKINKLIIEKFLDVMHYQEYEKSKRLFADIIDFDKYVDKCGSPLVHRMLDHRNYSYMAKYINLLANKGANFNLPDKRGDTPLWQRMGYCLDKNILEIVLKAGARLDICDSNGNYPLDIAVIRRNFDVVKLFLHYGATVTPEMLQSKRWEGTDLLQHAYDMQQSVDINNKMEVENKDFEGKCIICFESFPLMNNTFCKNAHNGAVLCEGCLGLLHNKEQPCPLCRGKLLDL